MTTMNQQDSDDQAIRLQQSHDGMKDVSFMISADLDVNKTKFIYKPPKSDSQSLKALKIKDFPLNNPVNKDFDGILSPDWIVNFVNKADADA